jgi:hypothetical protein
LDGIIPIYTLYTEVAQKTSFVPTIHYLPSQHGTHYQNKTKPLDYMRKEKRKKIKMRERREGRNEEGRRKEMLEEETSKEERCREWVQRGCRPTVGLGLAGHRDPRLRRLYFLIFSDESCSDGFDFFFL